MTLNVQDLPRRFKLPNGQIVDDPMPQGTLRQVRDLLATGCPELATATPEPEGPVLKDGAREYEWKRAIATKG